MAKPKQKTRTTKARLKTAPKATAATVVTVHGLAPFGLVETGPGRYSLLLTQFEPASEVFDAAGVEGGGYSWAGVARHVTTVVAPELAEGVGFDPEASMFCAYGEDRGALERLGVELARLFHDKAALAAVIEEVGPDGFED
ncbi:MAG: immunity 51 family protein [Deltaproteobacteria bacterium]|nr:immunity 51 family protein [Deltaproteobacteria bacterium]